MLSLNDYEKKNCLEVIEIIKLLKEMHDDKIIKIESDENYWLIGSSGADYNYIENRDEIISSIFKEKIKYFTQYGAYEECDEEDEEDEEKNIYINNIKVCDLETILETANDYNLSRIIELESVEFYESMEIGTYVIIENDIFKTFYKNKNNIESKRFLLNGIIEELIEEMIEDGRKNKDGYFNPLEVYDIGLNENSLIIFYGTCTTLSMVLKAYRDIFNFIMEDIKRCQN